MSKKESIKSHIDTLRAIFIAFMSAIFGILGYVIIHIDDGFSKLQTICGAVALLLLCAGLAFMAHQYFKLSKRLEKKK